MAEQKLTRATVAMCGDPHCSAEMVNRLGSGQWICPKCGTVWRVPYWGHYTPDIAGVVVSIKHELSQPLNDDGYLDVTRGFLTNLLDRLEGSNHE